MNTSMIQPGQRAKLLGQQDGSWSTVSICLWNQVSSAAQTPSEKKLRMTPGLLLLTRMQTIKILNPYENFISILGLQSLMCLSLPQIGHSQNYNHLIIIQPRVYCKYTNIHFFSAFQKAHLPTGHHNCTRKYNNIYLEKCAWIQLNVNGDKAGIC